MRDHRKLTAFQKADQLVIDVYRWTKVLPPDERYVLTPQIRRSAISVPSNIVEGSARLSHGEYANHLNVALGSAAELGYLIDLTGRLYPTALSVGNTLPTKADEVIRLLVGLVESLRSKPRAQSLEPRS